VEVEKLISALEEILVHLRNSEPSDYSHMSVEEINDKLDSELAKATNSLPVNTRLLGLLFAPTGPIQEIAIDNGWALEYLRISEVIDQFTETK